MKKPIYVLYTVYITKFIVYDGTVKQMENNAESCKISIQKIYNMRSLTDVA